MKLCAACNTRPVTGKSNRAKYCDECRAADRHRHRTRRRVPQMIVNVDLEGIQTGSAMKLWHASYGREDGTSGSLHTDDCRAAIRWLIDVTSGHHDGHRQIVQGFHFNWDSSLLARDLHPTELIHKAHASQRGLLCATEHEGGGRPCGKLHRYDPVDIDIIVTEGGESDVCAWEKDSQLAVAITPKRRFYAEYRPNGDRMEGRKVFDLHDIGHAFVGGLEEVLETWPHQLTPRQRRAIKAGKIARKTGFKGWTPELVSLYSESECIGAAQAARSLLTMIRLESGVTIRPDQLFGSGSIAGEVYRYHQLATRKETCADPSVDPLAGLCYFGGLIETIVVGRVRRHIQEDDINSAYPAAGLLLQCMREGHGHWQHHRGREGIPAEPVIGYVLATWDVETPTTPPFVLRYRKSGGVVQPKSGYRMWVPLVEYQSAVSRFGADVDAHEAVWWVQDCDCPPPLSFLSSIYEKRQTIKGQMKGLEKGSPQWMALNVRQEALKLILNSCYGKLAQRRPTPGKYTNLHYAAFITAWTRRKIREHTWAAEDAGYQPVYQHTDADLHDGPWDRETSNDLGGFKREKVSRDMVLVQPGLVTSLKGKTAARGVGDAEFRVKARRWANQVDLTEHPSRWPALEMTSRRMISRRMARHRGKPDLAASFCDHELTVRVSESKRDLRNAVPFPGEPEAWIVPPHRAVLRDLLCTSPEHVREFMSAIDRRIYQGEFDGE